MVTCPICNKSFKSLASHLRKHNISGADLLNQYPGTILVPNEIRSQVSASSKLAGCGKWRKGAKLSEEHKRKLSQLNSGEGNPFFGKKHTEETKKQMSENHADFTGNNNPFRKWIENEDNYNQWCLNRKIALDKRDKNTQEYIQYCAEISERVSQLYLDGKLEPYGKNHVSGHFNSLKFSDNFYYQSSYELKFLEYCENNDGVITLQKSPYRIPYKIDKKEYNYIPDFLINNKILVEIKPQSLLKFDKNPAKFKAARKFAKDNKIKYIIITEKELENLDDVLT